MSKKQFYDLREYVDYLRKIGDVEYIKAEVDPILEITEIASRVIKENGPALIFENVKGAAFPMAINLFGTEERVELERKREELEPKIEAERAKVNAVRDAHVEAFLKSREADG